MSRIIAILGDIHANLDALNVVLDDCRAQGVTDFLCTGDVVGYNACPHECMEIVRALGCPVVVGNHDYYVSSTQNLDDFNPQYIMNNAINEIKNTLEATNSRITEAEDRISEMEDRMVEINVAERKRGKK